MKGCCRFDAYPPQNILSIPAMNHTPPPAPPVTTLTHHERENPVANLLVSTRERPVYIVCQCAGEHWGSAPRHDAKVTKHPGNNSPFLPSFVRMNDVPLPWTANCECPTKGPGYQSTGTRG